MTVGLAISAIALLGFVVFYNGRSSITNKTFLLFSTAVIGWSVTNYLGAQPLSPYVAFLFLRSNIFFSVWYVFFLFQLFYVFPEQSVTFSKYYKYFLLPSALLISALTYTPLVFKKVISFSPAGTISTVENGPVLPIFGLMAILFIVLGIFFLLKKLLHAEGVQRRQFITILFGVIITFSLHIIYNLILPSIFNNPRYVPLGAVFTLPFIFCTAYAIIRHHLLNIKVVSTEILTFFLVVITLIELVFAQSVEAVFLSFFIFGLVLVTGIFLVRSVRREVEQRERLEIVTRELQIANERLKDLDQQKTDFLSIAAHQLRTPMSIMNGYLELISDNAYGHVTDETRGILKNMDESNQRLIKLVDEFLDITRIEQGRTKFEYVEVDMSKLVHSVVEELKQRAEDKGLKLNWAHPRSTLVVMGDNEKLRHVVFNFVDNAIKYSEHGVIKVVLAEENGGVGVKVTDHGFGFGEKDKHNFFQKFYRGDNVKKTEVSGTGLGLYVCRMFIENHKGKIWANSPGLGQGSEFGFWIPSRATAK